MSKEVDLARRFFKKLSLSGVNSMDKPRAVCYNRQRACRSCGISFFTVRRLLPKQRGNGMKVTVLQEGLIASNCYLVTDNEGDGALLIDPSVSPRQAELQCGTLPAVRRILLTHGHFDHMLTLEAWRELTGAPVAILCEDAPALTDPALNAHRLFFGEDAVYSPADRILCEGERIAVGRESLTVLSTPGHTPGSLCLDSGELLFTGDTLFADGGVGRCDLPGGEEAALRRSLLRLFSLPGERRIYPGHGRSCLLSETKEFF